jgi:hypothetical protein
VKCPKCYEHVASFGRWAIWPGPTRHCRNCGVKLRYVGFYPQVAAHAVLGAAIFFIFGEVMHTPIWILCIILAVVLSFTAFFLPWWFGRYREIAD